MKTRLFLLSLITVTAFTSCLDNADNPGGGKPTIEPLDPGGNYTVRTATVNRDGEKKGSIDLRFYTDKGDVPYVSVADFYKMMLPKENITVSRQGDLYTITTSGGTATVDVKKDLFSSTTFITLFDMNSLSGTDVPSGASYDGAPYLKAVSCNLLPQVSKADFNFKKYSIDLLDDGRNVFFPYATLADIFSDQALRITYYNPQDNEVPLNNSVAFKSFSTMDPNHSQRVFTKKEISDAMAAYRYSELCFVFDNLYGHPGHSNEMKLAGMETNGFDATLEEVSSGSEVKKLLKSKDNVAFVLGMDALQELLADGGHTSTSLSSNFIEFEEMMASYEALAEQKMDVAQLYINYVTKDNMNKEYKSVLKELRKKAYGSEKYIVSADKTTAVIVLDSFFDLDLDGWNAFYASGKTESDWATLLSRDKNLLATFLGGLQAARKDGVKNVVIDLTQNNGGSSDPALAILSLMAKNKELKQKALLLNDVVLTKQAMTCDYLVDRNFDGKFDAEDEKVDNSDINFAVLTSSYSFSCANLMPSLMKDAGFKVMGEKSSGGACSIQIHFTPDGMPFQISSFRLRLTNKNKESIDSGIPVDIEIPSVDFYNIDLIAEKLNAAL